MKNILGRKIGMTQIFQEDGSVVPVSVVEAGPLVVVQKKTVEKDGYNAIQIGFENLKSQRATKPLKGHFDKANVEYKKFADEHGISMRELACIATNEYILDHKGDF